MSSVETLNSMARKAVDERDSQTWRATFAAAQRVLAYHASKTEVDAAMRAGAGSSPAAPRQLAPALRMAA